MARDNTVAYETRRLQLPASPARVHYVKANVKVREYPDGTLAVFYGPRCLARYSAQGAEIAQRPDHPQAGHRARRRQGRCAPPPAVAYGHP